MTSPRPGGPAQAARDRLIAIALLLSMVLLAATSAWGFGSGYDLMGGILAVAAALEGVAAVYFFIRSNR